MAYVDASGSVLAERLHDSLIFVRLDFNDFELDCPLDDLVVCIALKLSVDVGLHLVLVDEEHDLESDARRHSLHCSIVRDLCDPVDTSLI